MDSLLTSFIRALRNADVRISTAETLDAFRAAELVGYRDRELLRNTLALTLPKTLDEKAAFDACFERFFSVRNGAPLQPAGDSSAGRVSIRPSDVEASDAGPYGVEPYGVGMNSDLQGEISSSQSPLGQLLLRANDLEINIEMNAAGRQVNVHEIEVFTQKGVYTRRIMEAMGYGALQLEIGKLDESVALPDRRLARDLTHRRDALRQRVRDFVEHQFLLHADVTGRRLREDMLRTVRLSSLEQRHHRLIHDIVRRMARRLVSAHSHRRKIFRRGQLHVPRTLRRNMKYDDAIFDLHFRSVKVDRPRVFAVCDVSGSVADYARFMLMFLYSLDEVLPKVRSFAFSSDLGEVSSLFSSNSIEDAISLTLRQFGGGSTDYGQALADFRKRCLSDLDKRATVIILGDARNNYGDARTDALKDIYDRSKRVIWLNPEPRALWNSGDSEMRHYAPYCHQVDECSTLAQLERFAGRLLR